MAESGAGFVGTLSMSIDLIVVALLSAAGATVSVAAPSAVPGPARVLLGSLFVFVLPGYAATAMLFPAMFIETDRRFVTDTDKPFGEGVVLAVGLSVAIVPLAVLLLNFTPWSIGPTSTISTVAIITIGVAGLAIARRYGTIRRGTAGVGLHRVKGGLSNRFRTGRSVRTAAEVTSVVLLVISAGIAGAALTDASGGEEYTELSLLTEDEATGNLTADGYPTSLQVGEITSVVVSVGNREGEQTQYTVVTQLQSVSTDSDERIVTRATRLNQFSFTVADGAVTRRQTQVSVSAVDDTDRHRLTVLLYRGEPPTNPTPANAYRQVHVWVSVTQ